MCPLDRVDHKGNMVDYAMATKTEIISIQKYYAVQNDHNTVHVVT